MKARQGGANATVSRNKSCGFMSHRVELRSLLTAAHRGLSCLPELETPHHWHIFSSCLASAYETCRTPQRSSGPWSQIARRPPPLPVRSFGGLHIRGPVPSSPVASCVASTHHRPLALGNYKKQSLNRLTSRAISDAAKAIARAPRDLG